MDYSYDKLKGLVEIHGGIISAAALQCAGIDRIKLYALLANEILKKESHGNYVLTENEPDEYKVIQNRSKKLIYSHETALFLHGISDCAPHILDITVPQGDNISRIKKAYENTRFHYCKRELWDLGIMDVSTPMGYSVRAYNLERSICDMIRDKNNVDKQVYIKAIREYFKNKCNPEKVIEYAKTFNIESTVRNYMEILR